jgi:hypothetical protein
VFVGHFAVGFAAKKFAPRISLALLLAAPLFLDLLWPLSLLLGWEHVRIDPGSTRFTPLNLYDYPWSHSLLMACLWATAFSITRLRATGQALSRSRLAWSATGCSTGSPPWAPLFPAVNSVPQPDRELPSHG